MKPGRRKSHHMIITSVCALFISYFCFHLLSGDRGLFAYLRLTSQISKTEFELAKIQKEKASITNKVNRLREATLDPDLLDEQARIILGYANSNEQVFFVKAIR